MTDFGYAGIKEVRLGKNGQIRQRLQIPWAYECEEEIDLFSLITKINEGFCHIESISMGRVHEVRLVHNRLHQLIDIRIYPKQIVVYPTTNNHQDVSETLLKAFKDVSYGGKLIAGVYHGDDKSVGKRNG